MDAIMLAGGTAGANDPLYPLCGGKPKSLLPIAGKPMGRWVLDALAGSGSIERIVIVGTGPIPELDIGRPVVHVPDRGSLPANVLAGLAAASVDRPDSSGALLISSDIPAIETRMIDWIIAQAEAQMCDLCYCAIEREVMEEKYPGSGRSYVRFRDMTVCGADAAFVRPAAITGNERIYSRLCDTRKSSRKMAAAIGFDVLLLLLLRRLTIAGAAAKISSRLGIRGRVVLSPYAELGMDVDKPFQHAILERDLESRTRRVCT